MRLNNNPERLPNSIATGAVIRKEQSEAGAVTRDDEGQRLAAARAEFRAAWQAKLVQ